MRCDSQVYAALMWRMSVYSDLRRNIYMKHKNEGSLGKHDQVKAIAVLRPGVARSNVSTDQQGRGGNRAITWYKAAGKSVSVL